jgi:hypothetical protein
MAISRSRPTDFIAIDLPLGRIGRSLAEDAAGAVRFGYGTIPVGVFASEMKINNKSALMLQGRHTFKQKTSNTRVVIRHGCLRR